MKATDFVEFEIEYFTKEEIEGTGAKIEDVDVELIVRLDELRKNIGRVIVLLPNGMTTGKHKSAWHPKGMAVDIAFREQDGPVDIQAVFIEALQMGFTGIGIYWNDVAYSFHLDIRPEYSFWRGIKSHREDEWKYLPLIHIRD